MRIRSSLAGVAVATAGAVAAVAAIAGAQAPPSPDAGATPGGARLVVHYERGKTEGDRRVQRFLRRNRVLEQVSSYAGERIALPHDIPPTGKSCGYANAFWDPETKTITYCYELVKQLKPVFRSQNTKGSPEQRTKATDEDLIGLTNGVLFHELGHGLVQLYNLPITGKEEDAVDQLATLLLAGGDEEHVDYAISTINAWAGLTQADQAPGLREYSDEHSFSAQRYYNETCWLYGSNPKRYADVVEKDGNPDGVLPQERAERCPDEYRQLSQSWSTLLKPYWKKQAGAASPAAADDDPGKLVAVYEPGQTEADRREERFLSRNRVLDRIAADAGARIVLPDIIGVKATSCGEPNSFWRSYQRQIVYCYEFAEKARKVFRQPDAQADGAKPTAAEVNEDVTGFTNAIVYHELGHALIDLYDLPTTGKEEDAVDQLAVLLLTTGDDRHAGYVIDTINAWGGFAAADKADPNATDGLDKYADEHSLDSQRFYNWACWLYGSDPDAYADVVQNDDNPDGMLPSSRAAGCDNEYHRIDKAWKTLLKPYLKAR
ncbi:DUF4344 domain-containing metallopeptidase [Streptomyces boninensis]|uniref:DUF4344 domain-containing metallopeptidase n=1 Tax=Streptomyces boninensis TaxID=2039455 RepID=UPI003B210F42